MKLYELNYASFSCTCHCDDVTRHCLFESAGHNLALCVKSEDSGDGHSGLYQALVARLSVPYPCHA